ncbi:hypothetical protein KL86DYS2_10120 [uncultured Dysgonomonas sp.]|uniref:Uncharacterized protein n=1 Tax=uncultured Dysgonomonas sp. TaxID=206096 RepID=A0A212IV78_9BACT|nr:hypothetical protein KL86DYS2_10120 [uncultured Dysgonomonas sp.]
MWLMSWRGFVMMRICGICCRRRSKYLHVLKPSILFGFNFNPKVLITKIMFVLIYSIQITIFAKYIKYLTDEADK